MPARPPFPAHWDWPPFLTRCSHEGKCASNLDVYPLGRMVGGKSRGEGTGFRPALRRPQQERDEKCGLVFLEPLHEGRIAGVLAQRVQIGVVLHPFLVVEAHLHRTLEVVHALLDFADLCVDAGDAV